MEKGINRQSIDIILENDQYYKSALRQLETIYDYAALILLNTQKIKTIEQHVIDKEDKLNKLEEIDESRHIKHDAAIASLTVLNNIAEKLDIEPVYPKKPRYDQQSRAEIGHDIITFVKSSLDLDQYGVIGNKR